MLRVALCCAFAVATSALAQPTLGSLIEAKPGNEIEPTPFYCFGTGVASTPDTYVMWWQDDRSSFPQLYGAILDVDGGVQVPGVRLLINHADLPDVGGAVACRRGNTFTFLVTSSSQATGVLLTDLQLQRQQFARIGGYQIGSTALSCGTTPTVWAFTDIFYPAGPVGHFMLRVNGVDGDGGVFELDGGNPLVPELNVATSEGVGPAIASDGVRSLVVWSGNPDGGANGLDVFGALVSGTSVFAPFLISGGSGDQSNPQLSWNGGASFFVSWEEGLAPVRDLNLARVSTTGTVLSAGFLANTSEDEYGQALGFDSSTIVAAWLTGAPKPTTLWLGTAPATTQPQFILRDDYVDEVHLASARDGQTLVQYRDFTRNIHSVAQFVNRFDAGEVVDPLFARRAQLEPTVLSGEYGFAALWTENGSQLLALLGGDGGVVDLGNFEVGRHIGGSPHGFMLLTPGANFTQGVRLNQRLVQVPPVVSFMNSPAESASDPEWTPEGFTFATASEDGGVTIDQLLHDGGLGAHQLVSSGEPEIFNLDVAYAGNSNTTLVSWSEHYLVHARCVTGFGVGGVPMVGARRDVGQGHYEARPRVASSGSEFLAVWVSERPMFPYTPLIVAQRLDASCLPVGSLIEIGEAVDPWNSGPRVVFDGLQYVVVWASNVDPMSDLVGVRVQVDGSVTGPFPVVTQTGSDVEPTLAPLAPGHWVVGFTHFFADEASSSRRFFVRRIDDRRSGTTCDNGSQCESGVCGEGTCCNRACATAADQCETCAGTGQCRPRSTGTVCRPSGASCDVAETCDGTNATCPADTSGMTCTLCDGTPVIFAVECGVPFTLPMNAIPIPDGGMPITYGVRSCDATPLPTGLAVNSSSGELMWTPPAGMGSTRVLVVGQGPNASATQVVQLDLSCPVDAGVDAGVDDAGVNDAGVSQSDAGLGADGGELAPRRLAVGCGCDASGGFSVLVLLALLRSRRSWLKQR
ncbi:MAG: hypothetical protein QM817_34500 [Archangium sp.]